MSRLLAIILWCHECRRSVSARDVRGLPFAHDYECRDCGNPILCDECGRPWSDEHECATAVQS